MRLNFTLFILLLCSFSITNAQKLTGIWRGYFSSSKGVYGEGNREEHYKYEIQLEQQSNNGVKGVTYSYKTTVFYGKAELSGIFSPLARTLLIKENKLVDIKIGDKSEPCLMTCYLDYSKIGKIEILEGTFISLNVNNKADCGSGKVYLERVPTSDFKKEDFLVKKKKADSLKAKILSADKPLASSKLPNSRKPHSTQKIATFKADPKKNKLPSKAIPAERIPEQLVNSKKHEAAKTQETPNPSHNIPIPKVLLERENNLVRTITTSEEDIQIDLYDNGIIDNDTISVYHNNELVISSGRLSYTPIVIKIKCSKTNNHHEFTVVAENLGDISPNTALMVIKAGNQKERYEIFLASTEQRNAKVVINFVPKD